MQQPAVNSPSPVSPSFAGLLASLTAPAPRTAWNNDDLAEDVATLSYEHALRAHGRYQSTDFGGDPFAMAAGPGVTQTKENPAEQKSTAARESSLWDAPGWNQAAEAHSAKDAGNLLEENKKCASITIRLSKTECDQLRKRAAQAGLTVSAYLRSCTFEAEALRAQVKDVLAELRKSATTEEEPKPAEARRSWVNWFSWLMPRWRTPQRLVRA